MKNIKYNIVFLLISILGFTLNSIAQCKTEDPDKRRPFYEVETECAITNSEPSFLTDGKEYRALLSNNEAADFVVLFYSNNTYRIAACTDIGGPLSFIVRDKKKNILFTNKDYENAPYWDLVFPATIECKITVKLPEETIKLAYGGTLPEESKEEVAAVESNDSTEVPAEEPAKPAAKSKSTVSDVCAVLLIGYKQE